MNVDSITGHVVFFSLLRPGEQQLHDQAQGSESDDGDFLGEYMFRECSRQTSDLLRVERFRKSGSPGSSRALLIARA